MEFTEALVQREQIDRTHGEQSVLDQSGRRLVADRWICGGRIVAGKVLWGATGGADCGRGFRIHLSEQHVGDPSGAAEARNAVSPRWPRTDVVARAVSVVVSICFGLAGWGYWALVLGVMRTAVKYGHRCVDHVPLDAGAPRQAEGTGAMLKFAMYTYGRFSVNYFARNTDNLLVGWRFGAPALGFYKKAYDLFSLSAAQLVASTRWLRCRH